MVGLTLPWALQSSPLDRGQAEVIDETVIHRLRPTQHSATRVGGMSGFAMSTLGVRSGGSGQPILGRRSSRGSGGRLGRQLIGGHVQESCLLFL